MDVESFQMLKNDREYAICYIQQLVQSGSLSNVGVGADTYVSAFTCFLGMPDEFEIKICGSEEALSPVAAGVDCTVDKDYCTGETSWPKAAARPLIEIRYEMDNKFENPPCKKVKLWEKVAEKMKITGGYHYSGDEVDKKWKSLMQTFCVNVDKASRSGESGISWEYYNLMIELFDKKNSSNPPDGQLQSSPLATNPGSSSEKTPKRNAATTPQGPPNKRKSSLPEEAPAWFAKFLADKKETDERFLEEQRQSRELEETKLNLLKDLLMQKRKD